MLCAKVITVADFHPRHCHTFAFATSKGAIRMADLRTSALLDNACKIYEEVCPPSPHAQLHISPILLEPISDAFALWLISIMSARDADLHLE